MASSGNDVKTKILDIQVRYKDAVDQLAAYRKAVSDTQAQQKELKKQLDAGAISQQEYARQYETSRLFIQQQNTAINTLSRQIQNQMKTETAAVGSLVQWRAELSNLTSEYDNLSQAEREGARGSELQNKINEVTKKLKEAEYATQRFYRNVGNYPNAMSSAEDATEELEWALTKQAKTAKEAERQNEILRKAISSIDKSAEGAEEAIDEYNKKIAENSQIIEENNSRSEGLVDSMSDLLGINTKFGSSLQSLSQNSAGSMLDGLKIKAQALGKALLTLLANPYVLAFLGIAGAVMAVKWWYDYNVGLMKATRLTQDLTGKTGDDLKAFRNEVQATADTFGQDFQDVLNSANSVSQQFGISVEEALNHIQDGFIAGADANGNYLDSLEEFPAYFKQAGLSADQFIAIVAQSNKMGVVGNKALDSIKEADIRLREMTKSTAEALDGIGLSSDAVQKALAEGSKTTFDIMQEVSSKLAEMPENAQEVGTAVADIFGGPGEDAGLKYLTTLKDISLDLDEVKEKTGVLGALQEEQLQSQIELDNAVAALFDQTGGTFESMMTSAKIFVNKGITAMIKGIIGICNYFIDLYNESLAFRIIWNGIVANFKNSIDFIGNLFNFLIDLCKALGRVLKGVFTLNVDEIVAGSKQFASAMPKLINAQIQDMKENYSEAIEGLHEKVELIEIPVLIDDETTTGTSGSSGGGNKPKKEKTGTSGSSNSKKAAEDEAQKLQKEEEAKLLKRAEDELLKITQESAETRRKQLALKYDREIEDLKKKLETDKTLTKKGREAINSIISSLETQKQNELQKFDNEELRKAAEQKSKLLALEIAAAKKNSEEEKKLKLEELKEKETLELLQAEKEYTNEEEKQRALAAIRAKYRNEEEAIKEAYAQKEYERQKQVLANEIAEMENAETEKQLHRSGFRVMTDEELEADQQRKLESIGGFEAQKLQKEEEAAQIAYEKLVKRGQLSTQTEEEYQAELNASKEEWLNKQVAINDAYVKNEQAKQQAVKAVVGGLTSLLDTLGESNEAFAKMSKIITLAQIAIDTGKALSAGIASASAVPFPGNLAAIATTVATVLANVATAISTVKSAKFAEGGKVIGPGTGTSDSIPAQLSNGEYVMTAKATRLFEPLLGVMNAIGSNTPMQVAHSYVSVDSAEMMTNSFETAARQIKPIVSVVEITEAQERVEMIENLDTF